MPTLILIYCHFSYIATNKKGEITSEETVHCLFGRGPLPNFLPLLWTRFVGYGASDTGTRNWGRGSRISLCTSAVHTYTIYIRLHNLKKKRAFSISYNRSSSHCWTFIGSTIVLETISST